MDNNDATGVFEGASEGVTIDVGDGDTIASCNIVTQAAINPVKKNKIVILHKPRMLRLIDPLFTWPAV